MLSSIQQVTCFIKSVDLDLQLTASTSIFDATQIISILEIILENETNLGLNYYRKQNKEISKILLSYVKFQILASAFSDFA